MLYYITSNADKIRVAKKYLEPLGIKIERKHLDLLEIQSNSIDEIAAYKAKQAFERLQHPLFVMDAGWYIPSLNGFPGPYMKYINEWFTSEDFLNLMRNKQDRTIIYKEVFYYIDNKQEKKFIGERKGKVLNKEEGEGILSWRIFSLRKDGKSIAKAWEENAPPVDQYPIWEEFVEWYKKKNP